MTSFERIFLKSEVENFSPFLFLHSVVSIKLNFFLESIFLTGLKFHHRPECFLFNITVSFFRFKRPFLFHSSNRLRYSFQMVDLYLQTEFLLLLFVSSYLRNDDQNLRLDTNTPRLESSPLSVSVYVPAGNVLI